MRKRFVYVICDKGSFDGSPIAIFLKFCDAESWLNKFSRPFRSLYIEKRRLFCYEDKVKS